MKRSNMNTNTNTNISFHNGQRVTRISHLRKGQQQKKSKPNPCVLMTGVITTILMTFIYLVTSSMHRTMVEESEAQQRLYQLMKDKNKSLQQQQLQQGSITPTFVTVVLPSVVNTKGRRKRLNSIANTWGPAANAIFVTHEDHEYEYAYIPPIIDIGVTVDADAHVGAHVDVNVNPHVGAHVGASANNHEEEDEEFTTPARTRTNTNTDTNTNLNIYPQILKVPSSVATIDQGVPRLQYVMETVYKKYNPDYVFFVNDHTFVIPQHMCDFVNRSTDPNHSNSSNSNSNSQNINQKYGINQNIDISPNNHLYAGHALKPKGTNYAFNSGAAGYFLSRRSMKELIEKTNNSSDSNSSSNGSSNNDSKNGNKSNSNNKSKTESEHDNSSECKGERKWLQGNPGLVTANCLKMTMDVDPIDTRDDLGRHLFHAYGLVRTVKGDFDSWYVNKHGTLKEIWGEDKKHNFELKKGKECCSPQTISFHYVEFAETIALHATFQKILDVGGASKITNDELQKFMISNWPKDKKDIGGYSHHLPPLGKKDVWENLLYVVKNIAPKNSFERC